MQGKFRFSNTTIASILFFCIFFLPLVSLADGLENPGFENDLESWTIKKESDEIIVVGSEDIVVSKHHKHRHKHNNKEHSHKHEHEHEHEHRHEKHHHDDTQFKVHPYVGEKMLRMGELEKKNKPQKKGKNSVQQKFTASSSSILFSFRLFSWEHRGHDSFGFDLRDSKGKSGFLVNKGKFKLATGPGRKAKRCKKTPCNFSIDVGKKGKFLDSQWVVVEISGLTVGNEYTLKYKLKTGKNKAHRSWVYLDNANTPPVAKFSFIQDGIIEGDPVTFNDASTDPDSGDNIVSWEWTVEGPNFDSSIVVEDQNPIFVFPDDGHYTVTLTVTDTFGQSNSVSTNSTATDGTHIPALNVNNEPILQKALNQEVLAGENVELIGRFVDPGFLDTHTATWNGIDATQAIVREENIPAIASGLVTGQFIAPNLAQTLSGILTVTDNNGAAESTDFTLKVVAPDFDTREPNDTLAEAPQLPSEWIYLSSIDYFGDVDIFEVRTPSGDELDAGSEVLVKLKNLPADYDLVVLSEIPGSESTSPWLRSPWLRSPFQTTPWLRSPWLRSPWLRSPWLRSPWLRSPWLRSPWLRSPWLRSPWLRSPWLRSASGELLMTLDQIPLSELAYTLAEGDGIGGSDLALSELGLDAISTSNGVSVAGFSANRGLKQEELLVRTEYPGTRIYVVVKSNNGIFTPEPYSLQIETSRPFEITNYLGDACNGTPVVTAADATHSSSVIGDVNTANTLFITQLERVKATYNMDDQASNEFQNKLQNLSSHTAVNGAILSLPSSLYDSWDSNPCSSAEANRVSGEIRKEIAAILKDNPGIQYVSIVGSDNIVPFRRVTDETSISNERLYAFDSLLVPGSPLFISSYEGYNLTDDYYVDPDPIIWQGRELYVPRISISRLVETPEEIVSTIDAFLAVDGKLDASTALVTGYDFFKDGARRSADFLAGNIDTETLITDDWSADDIRCRLLGNTSAPGCRTHDVNAFNAHFSHFGALSAFGFTFEVYDDFISSAEVAEAHENGPGLLNTINTSLGCHAGLSVPDGTALTGVFGDGIDPNLDFAQAMAQQNALFVGSTGYGLGDDTAIAGTELLMALFSKELAKGGSIGQALTNAKRNYVSSVSSFTVYDEKSMIQTTLYGLPMFQVMPASTSVPTPPVPDGTPVETFTLTIEDDGQTTSTSHTLYEVISDKGTFYTADGSHQVTELRPIQPKVVQDVSSSLPVHGILITDASYVRTPGVNPVVSTMKQEWLRDTGEQQVCFNASWPSLLATTNNLETRSGLKQSLVVVPGNFRCTSGPGKDVQGVQQLFTSMTVKILRSASTDYNPPVIDEVNFRDNGDGSRTLIISARDASGIANMSLIVDVNGKIVTIPDSVITRTGKREITIPGFIEGSKFIVQAIDGAGNVTHWTGKGVSVSSIQVSAEAQQATTTQGTFLLTATVAGFADLLNESSSIFYRWDFGDGNFGFGKLAKDGIVDPDVNIDAQGNAVFTVEHLYSGTSDVTATIKVMDSFGGIGTDDTLIQLQAPSPQNPDCDDPLDVPGIPDIDLLGCSVTNNGASTISVTLKVAGTIHPNTRFKVHVDHSGGFTDRGTPDGMPDGKPDLVLSVSDGFTNGLSSLTATETDQDGDGLNESIVLTFDLAEIGVSVSDINWFATAELVETNQAPIVDSMPDAGLFSYQIQL